MSKRSTTQEWIIVVGGAELLSLVKSASTHADADLRLDSTSDPGLLIAVIDNREVDLVVCDSRLIPDPGSFLEEFNDANPEIPLALVSRSQEIENVVDIMRKGAFHVLPEPVNPHEMHRMLMLALVVARNRRELRERKRIMLRDMEMAQHIQLSLLPPREIALPTGAVISTRHIPAEILGGDFFDVTEIDDLHIGIIMADVCGHGVAASLVVVVLKTLLLNAAPFVKTPSMFLEHLNVQLLKIVPESYYLTCFYGILNTTTGLLKYASCGHPPPFLVRKSGTLERLKSRGFFLGLDPQLDLEEQSTVLEANDQIIAFTDGLVDIQIDAQESYGDNRLERCLAANIGLPASQILDRVIENVHDLTHGRIPDDDIALMCVEYRPQIELKSAADSSSQASERTELDAVKNLLD
jgi:serine phosphatase RsbU (regulator of sigma subunit)